MPSLNKTELVAEVADRSGMSRRDSERAVNAFVEAVEGALGRGDRVVIAGFGTFEVRDRRPRVGRNPQTGEALQIPAGRVPAFKAGKGLKDSVER
jgi:DNA-binding protein HU-beta